MAKNAVKKLKDLYDKAKSRKSIPPPGFESIKEGEHKGKWKIKLGPGEKVMVKCGSLKGKAFQDCKKKIEGGK